MNNELDDMKQLWQNNPAPASPLDEQQLNAMLAMRSKTALGKLRNNLLLEAFLGAALLILMTRQAIVAPNDQARFAMIEMALLILPLFIFYYYGLQSLQKGLSFSGNLRESLQESIAFWERSLRVYFWGGMILMPATIIAAASYRMGLNGESSILFFGSSTTVVLLKMLGLSLFAGALVLVLIRFSYGIYLEKLRQCLAELNG
jgi:hypothetical protein